ncbi:MAG: hypothetical protein KJZ75_11495 [Hyphomonadaceae bacterium]|nr:hypothetical protein [Hyphomonadaceae bacterium]
MHRYRGAALRERERLQALFPEKTFRVVRISRQNSANAPDQARRLSEMPAVAALASLPAPAPPTEDVVAKFAAAAISRFLRAKHSHAGWTDDEIDAAATECARIALATFNTEAANV